MTLFMYVVCMCVCVCVYWRTKTRGNGTHLTVYRQELKVRLGNLLATLAQGQRMCRGFYSFHNRRRRDDDRTDQAGGEVVEREPEYGVVTYTTNCQLSPTFGFLMVSM